VNVLIGANDVLLNLDNNQLAFQNTVEQLSSGLRVNTAADDPSGYAIATNLTSKVGGLQQAVNNVQNGINALNVANGALTAVQNILIRVNTLIVEANSDINSTSDLQDIQSEINSLLTEVNTIGEKTNFNGQNLLNGQFDTSEGSNPSITEVASPFGSGSTNVSDYNGDGDAGPLVTGAIVPPTLGYAVPASFVVFTVTGYSDDALDPDSQTYVGPGVYLQVDAYSTQGDFSSTPLFQDVSAVPVNSGQISDLLVTSPDGQQELLQYTLSNLTEADVGSTIAFFTTGGTAPAGGQALTINDGGSEGETVSMSLPTINTNALNLTGVSVLDPQTAGYPPNGTYVPTDEGASSSNNIAASYSEILVQNALTTVTTNEAQIGSQIVAMNDDESNDNTTATNLQASASNITDLNVGQGTTDYTREQILTSVGTEVLSQIQSNAKILTALLINALVA
jgi:flagellin